jgi:hypothetical protein
LVFENKTRANTYGGEVFVNWNVTPRWRISPGYSRLQMNIVRDPSSVDVHPELTPGSVPMQQFQIRSSVMLGQNLLTQRHAEFPDELGTSHTLVERSLKSARQPFRIHKAEFERFSREGSGIKQAAVPL